MSDEFKEFETVPKPTLTLNPFGTAEEPKPPAEPEPEKEGRKAFVMNSTLRDLMRLPALRLALPLIQKIAERESGEFISRDRVGDMILDSPLRQLPMGTDGKISARQVKGIVEIFNGRVLKGLKLLAGKKTSGR